MTSQNLPVGAVDPLFESSGPMRPSAIYRVATTDGRELHLCGPCRRDGKAGTSSRRSILDRRSNGEWCCQLCGAR